VVKREIDTKVPMAPKCYPTFSIWACRLSPPRYTNFSIEVEKVCVLVISLITLHYFNSTSNKWVGIGGRGLTFHFVRSFSDYKTPSQTSNMIINPFYFSKKKLIRII